MQNNLYSITKKDLFDLFGRLAADSRMIVPYSAGDKLYFADFDIKKEDQIELGGIRQSQPLKSFISRARENVAAPSAGKRPVVIAGVKACDLSSLLLQDFVFLGGGTEDPFYSDSRNNTTIIAFDCTYSKETCFCTAMEGSPYPKSYFDLSLAAVDNYFMVEVGSPKGRKIVEAFQSFFKNPPYRGAEIRQALRERVSKQVRDSVEKRGTANTGQIKGVVKKGYNMTEFWQDMASTCVECGACNLVCPTCHCFLLFDGRDRSAAKRFKAWDACLYGTFARVAGDHNPRKHLHERLRNRFDKKFEFFPETLNYFACTGCGRCIEACPGDIDIREVMKGLVSGKWSKPPHD